MMPARLVVLASGGGRTLENLQGQILNGKLNARIELVVASEATLGAVEKAKQLGLSILVVSKKSYPDRKQREHRLLGAILEARPDLVILAGWLQLLPIPAELEGKVLNIHPALLPAFGGKGFFGHHVHQAVSAARVSITGCTVHFATSQYDVGPVVLQACVSITPGENPKVIADTVFEKECAVYPEAIQALIEGRAQWEHGEVLWN